ncbi:MAG: hypothetical protein AB7P21_02950 [Lautropia sp.]
MRFGRRAAMARVRAAAGIRRRGVSPRLVGAGLAACLLQACGGGGGGSDATAVSGGLPAFSGKCSPGLVRGFTGGFDDRPVNVLNTGDGGGGGGSGGSGGAGVGGDGGGAPGAGIGGALGQFVNVDVTAEFASGERFGPVRVDDAKGMVTIVPCALVPPVLVTFSGAPGSGARYFDESLGREVSFEGQTLRSVVTAFDKNAGVTSFTEALVRRTERLSAESGGSLARGWTDPQRVERAHADVRAAVNDQLPGDLRIEDLRRLPVILNQRNFVDGSAVLSDTQNGRYGAVLAGFARTGGDNLVAASPALEINRQFATDMADGRLDLLDAGRTITGGNTAAYTLSALWTNQTLQTTQAARSAGTGTLKNALVTFDFTRVGVVGGPAGNAEIQVTHRSDGTLQYAISSSDCPRGTQAFTFTDVRQKALLGAISRDGRTWYSVLPTADPCAPRFAVPFDVPGARIAWLESRGELVRTTDGRLFAYDTAGFRWFQITLEGPRKVQLVQAPDYLWGVTEGGELYRHYFEQGGFVADATTGGVRSAPGATMKVAMPAPVALIAASADRRELFALTTTRELYWIDIRDPGGVRSPAFAPRPLKLDVGTVCWISNGVVAVACDGTWHRTVEPLSDPNAPPVRRISDATGLTIVPGVGGLRVSPIVPAVTPIWRSTDSFGIAPGTTTPLAELTSPARLIGVDGSVRTLAGELATAAR